MTLTRLWPAHITTLISGICILFAFLLAVIQAFASAENELLYTIHSLKKGETLWSLAELYYGNGRFASLLAEYNNIDDITDIDVGLRVRIPYAMLYTVKRGDTLLKIARVLLGDGEKYRDIANYNGISNPNVIEVGQIVKIPLILPERIPEPVEEEIVGQASEEVSPPIPEELKPVTPPVEEKRITAPTEHERPIIPPGESQKPIREKPEDSFIPEERVDLLIPEKPAIPEKPEPEQEEKEKIALSVVVDKLERDYAVADSVQRDLIEKGFENVSVTLGGERIIVAYEDRMYRHEIKGIREIMASVPSLFDAEINLTLIPKKRNIPVVAINVSGNGLPLRSTGEETPDHFHEVDVSLNVDGAWKEARDTRKENSSNLKFDIVLHPQIRALLGDHEDPVRMQVNFLPELRTTLWKGMSLSGQLIIPIYNEIGEFENYWRPGLITISQIVRLPGDTFLSATAGYFTQNRYGLDLEVLKYLANGRLFLGANSGYTGYTSYKTLTWYHSGIGVLTAFINAGCRLPVFDLSFIATYGKFLYGDRGYQFDMLRQFGEVDIGFFALKTEGGYNGGFRFSIPLPPARYALTSRFRVSPAREFQWEYRYKAIPRNGIQYSTGNGINDFIRKLNPDYVESYIDDAKD